MLNPLQNCHKIAVQRKQQKELVLPLIFNLRNPLRIPLLTWTNTSQVFFSREIVNSFQCVDVGGFRMPNVTPCWLCAKKHVLINSQELYSMQNYTSRQTQMTKLLTFLKPDSFFQWRCRKKKGQRTPNILLLYSAYSYSNTKPSDITSWGKWRVSHLGPRSRSKQGLGRTAEGGGGVWRKRVLGETFSSLLFSTTPWEEV